MIDIKKRHEYWWNYLVTRVQVPDGFDERPPRIKLVNRRTHVTGRANRYECEYNLNYAARGNGYDETVCHEICHAFAMRIFPWEVHNSLWQYLYSVVCGFSHGHHTGLVQISRDEAQLIRDLLKTQEKLAACKNKR